MPSYINSTLKASVRQAYSNLQESFSRNITVYKHGTIVKIATDPNYNSLYGSGITESVTHVEVSETMLARVIYEKLDENVLADEDLTKQAKIKMPDGWIRIIVDLDGFAFLKEAKKAEVDGRKYKIKSDGKARGLFEPAFYEFTLTPLDEGE